uniref:PA2c domain-containing protein n=1 Tax=Trichuris muris TaxID=70415 RepID=A0A5S6QMS7_TRIMR
MPTTEGRILRALSALLIAALPYCCVSMELSDLMTTPEPPDLHVLRNLSVPVDFVLIEKLSNDEQQIFTQNGSCWSQILTLSNSTDPGVSLIISANEQVVVKSIYRIDNQLLDCDILGETEPAKFVEGFQNEITRVVNLGNYEFHWMNEPNYTMHPTQLQSLQVEQQKERCLELHKTLLQATTKASGRQKRHDRRLRRSLFFPGTFWCGTGTRAQSAAQIGEHTEADKCCRLHDQCPMAIGGFSQQYQLFNHRAYSISLCDCDKQFYECLKKANTSAANMVGKIFFNIMRAPCFTLSLENACEHYSWWGTCRAKRTQWVAKLNVTDWF